MKSGINKDEGLVSPTREREGNMRGKNIEKHVTITKERKEGEVDYSNSLRELQITTVEQVPSAIQTPILENLTNIPIELPESSGILKESGNIDRFKQDADILAAGKLLRKK